MAASSSGAAREAGLGGEIVPLALEQPASGWQIAGPIALVLGIVFVRFRRPLGEFLPMARTDRVNHLLPLIPGTAFVLFGVYVMLAGVFGT